jgi:hypothetical protein
MALLLQEIGSRLTSLGTNWMTYSVVANLVLYIVGYLSLRFHLTAMGLGTDLDLPVFDERYLFTGARFLVYLVSAVPSIVLVSLPLALVAWAARHSVPEGVRLRARLWLLDAHRLTIVGIVFSVLMIQLVMRQCFVFSDLLLAPALPQTPAWLVNLLVDGSLMPLYFSALVAASAVPIAILVAVRDVPTAGFAAFARGLLVFLAAVQLLLLPINYGVLIIDKTLPRVASLNDKRPLAAGDQAWLLWEGKNGNTYLVRASDRRRSLVTLPRGDTPTEIVSFDPILPALFGRR